MAYRFTKSGKTAVPRPPEPPRTAADDKRTFDMRPKPMVERRPPVHAETSETVETPVKSDT